MVRAKFKLVRVERSISTKQKDVTKGWNADNIEPVEMQTLVFSPVYGNGDPNHENTKFWQASPSGEIKLGTVNPEAWKAFQLDHEYYIDFHPALPATWTEASA